MDRMSFTWFPKLTATIEKVPEEFRMELFMAIVRYGTYGEEPDLDWPLDAIFASVREDIENSWKARKFGSDGGRKNAKADSKAPSRGVEAPLDDAEGGFKGGLDAPKGGSDKPKGGSSNTIPNHTKETIPSHTNPGSESAKRKRFAPPARDEALAYGSEIGLPEREVDRFLDHFAANGWKVSGKAPMRDWRASMRNWLRNVPDFQRDGPPPGRSMPKTFDPDEERRKFERQKAAYDAAMRGRGSDDG